MLLIQGAKTMFIIVFSMILIVATMIYIVFAKIGDVLKCLKYVWGICYIINLGNDIAVDPTARIVTIVNRPPPRIRGTPPNLWGEF